MEYTYKLPISTQEGFIEKTLDITFLNESNKEGVLYTDLLYVIQADLLHNENFYGRKAIIFTAIEKLKEQLKQ